jgi:hypothetical protein
MNFKGFDVSVGGFYDYCSGVIGYVLLSFLMMFNIRQSLSTCQ